MTQDNLRIFDPRKNEEYFHVGAASTVRSGLLVLESVSKPLLLGLGVRFQDSIDLVALVPQITDCMSRAAPVGSGFAIVAPRPEGFDLSVVGISDIESHEPTDAVCGYFLPEQGIVTSFLELRTRKESWREWIVGSCRARLNPHPRDGYSFGQFVDDIESGGCFFRQEGPWVTMMIKLFQGIDEIVSQIMERAKTRTG